jgi:hypothetical protein
MGNSHEIVIAGAHRGQKTLVKHMLPEYARSLDQGFIYDPEPGRSRELKLLWEKVSPRAEFLPYEKPIEHIVSEGKADKDSMLILTLDTIDSMAYVLENTENPSQLQFLLQGPGSKSPVLGISGTIAKGDKYSRDSSVKLLKALSPYAPPRSSQAIWGTNQLNAYVLSSMRNTVSRYSAQRLANVCNDSRHINSHLTVIFDYKQFPLKVVDYPEVKGWRELEQYALSTSEYSNSAVALVDKERTALFLTEGKMNGRRWTLYSVLLQKLLPTHTDGGWDQEGVVTD